MRPTSAPTCVAHQWRRFRRNARHTDSRHHAEHPHSALTSASTLATRYMRAMLRGPSWPPPINGLHRKLAKSRGSCKPTSRSQPRRFDLAGYGAVGPLTRSSVSAGHPVLTRSRGEDLPARSCAGVRGANRVRRAEQRRWRISLPSGSPSFLVAAITLGRPFRAGMRRKAWNGTCFCRGRRRGLVGVGARPPPPHLPWNSMVRRS